MSKYISKILIVISIVYVLIIYFTIRESYFNSTSVNDIVTITTSFITLIIVLLLFDRFDYRRIIFEKKLNLVLELLEFIKSTNIHFKYSNNATSKSSFGFININEKEINFCLKKEKLIDENSFVLFHYEELNNGYFQKISKFYSNPYLPKELLSSLEFLIINSLEGIEEKDKYKQNHVKLTINRNPKDLNNTENWYKPFKEIKAGEFFHNHLKLFNDIVNWIDKHSNVKSKLNV